MKTRTKNRSCNGKRQFASKPDAEAAMWKLIRQHLADRRLIHAYQCSFGDHWHIGHKGTRR